ncbi:polysaccharide export protein [Sphingobium sp. BYY-5]|uniref:polysaccharide biosynthesis/export family protein n=1 Tax=Sphingobium sp. BYY-5 TaxID=2926400 RepID=UPI001FA7F7D4|nr:polysaccharide biosynthesis/export family protein [Sphingobium sp. BYY-5]MCI4588654.1 polysaccharide export protein [Sphingobium sp. BYY-5]
MFEDWFVERLILHAMSSRGALGEFMNRLSHCLIGARLPKLCLVSILLATSACTTVGPRTSQIANAGKSESISIQGIQVINLDAPMVAQRVRTSTPDFAGELGASPAVSEIVGAGDVLRITIWEAPPAVLFGGSNSDIANVDTSRSTVLPDFVVDPSGYISIPFAGQVQVMGRTLPDIEKAIVNRLRGKAHLPEVAARLFRNVSANASVVGEVTTSGRIPLSPKGETILDAIAAAGGTKHPAEKMTVQISRGGKVFSMPLTSVINDPRQNVVLRPGDIVTALFQPYSFIALGAIGQNQEITFEATGITFAQAVGRIGGLQDGRADPRGVFLFRWEDPAVVPNLGPDVAARPDGRVPVIYRADMKDPATYFMMQYFQIRNKDVLYVSSNPISDVQRVINLLASTILPIATVDNVVNRN